MNEERVWWFKVCGPESDLARMVVHGSGIGNGGGQVAGKPFARQHFTTRTLLNP